MNTELFAFVAKFSTFWIETCKHDIFLCTRSRSTFLLVLLMPAYNRMVVGYSGTFHFNIVGFKRELLFLKSSVNLNKSPIKQHKD